MLKTILLLSLTPLATVAQSSPDVFAGNYSDPNHPKCPRTVIVENNAMGTVTGADAATKGDPCEMQIVKREVILLVVLWRKYVFNLVFLVSVLVQIKIRTVVPTLCIA